MMSSASPSRSLRLAAAGAVAAAVLVAAAAPRAARAQAGPYADRFPNLVLKTHEGKHVRFYEDLLRGKVVVINFMYVTCTAR
jgi:protein SCO1/2